MTKTYYVNSKRTNAVMAIMLNLFVALCVFTAIQDVHASGLGTSYYMENGGYVFVKVVKEPHKSARAWGYVDEVSGQDVEVGSTNEGVAFDLGWFDEEIGIVFWVQGQNKRFYTGKGNCTTTEEQFVINGTKFEIYIEEGNSEMAGVSKVQVYEAVKSDDGTNDCSDPSVDYIQGNATKLERFYNRTTDLEVLRVVMNVRSDWSQFIDADCTAEVTLNNSCALTVSATDEIGYFKIDSKRYEGRKLTSYDFPEGVTYLGKLRVTNENGVDKMYIYLNNMDVSDLVGSNVNVKVRLSQNGEIVQAFETEQRMTEKIK